MSNRRVLVIGLDGGTWDLLEPLARDGVMPFLSSLLSTGRKHVLLSTRPPMTPAAWSTFQTGLAPHRHGKLSFIEWDRNTKETRPASGINMPTRLWDYTSAGGLRAGVVDVPMTYPPSPLNGEMVSGWVVPTTAEEVTYPPELQPELGRICSRVSLDLKVESYAAPHTNLPAFISDMTSLLCERATLAHYLLATRYYDLFILQIHAVDLVQHGCWRYLWPGDPRYDAGKRAYILTFYRSLDQVMHEVWTSFRGQASTESLLLIISDHGFQSNLWQVNIGNWLKERDLLALEIRQMKADWDRCMFTWLRGLDWLRLRRLLPKVLRRSLSRRIAAPKVVYNWQRTSVFAKGRDYWGFLFLLTPLSEQHPLIERLTKSLRELRNPANDQPVIQNVWTRHELYGPTAPVSFPDLILEASPGYNIVGVPQPDQDIIHPVPNTEFQQGIHHPHGMLLVHGEGVKEISKTVGKYHIVDLLPTILSYLGICPPTGLDGRCLDDLIDCGGQMHSPSFPMLSLREAGMAFTAKEQKHLEQRLHNLGYL